MESNTQYLLKKKSSFIGSESIYF
nr:NADH-plastoquinone oxidoreductase subunit K [Stipa caucasica subsp. glareosa]WDQ42667.1 NADH-plastoquinone oxidoreductase subunit K [Stipa caucasica]